MTDPEHPFEYMVGQNGTEDTELQRYETLRQLAAADPEEDSSSTENVLKAAAVIGGAVLVTGAIIGFRRHRTKGNTEVSLGTGDRHDEGLLATFVDMAGDLAASLPSREEAVEELSKDANYKRVFAMTKKGVVYPLKGDPEHVKEYAKRIGKIRGAVIDLLSTNKKQGNDK